MNTASPTAPVAVDDGNPTRETRRVLVRPGGQRWVWALALVLTAASAAVFVNAITAMPAYDESPLPWPFFAVAFGIAEIAVIHFSVRGQAVTVSLAEIPLVIGFYFGIPAELVLAQLAGTAVVLVLVRRQLGVKLVFNLALFTLTASLALLTFRSLAPPTLDNLLVWWLASFAGTSVVVLVSAPSIAAAISLSVRTFQPSALGAGLVFGILAAAVNTSVALLAVVFLRTNPQDLWLVFAPSVVIGLGYRAYASQRERQARVEFLYDCARVLQRSFLDGDTLEELLTLTRDRFHAEVAEIVLSPQGGPAHSTRTVVGPGADVQHAARIDDELLGERIALLGPGGTGALVRRPTTGTATLAHLASEGLRNAVIAPLRGKDGVVGTLLVGNRVAHRGSFGREDLRLLETLAVHAGVALENSGLVDRLAESLASVTQLAAAVQSSDDAILALAADGAITGFASGRGRQHIMAQRRNRVIHDVFLPRRPAVRASASQIFLGTTTMRRFGSSPIDCVATPALSRSAMWIQRRSRAGIGSNCSIFPVSTTRSAARVARSTSWRSRRPR